LTRKRPRSNLQQALAARIRAECNRRGWSMGELAKRTGISRTTLFNVENSRTGRPHIETVRKIALALELPVEVLLGEESEPVHRQQSSPRDVARQQAAVQSFDAATNPAVAEVMREQPHLFDGWSPDEVEELESLFGTGGGLTPRGVELAAESINRRRETIHKLQVVLETHLSKQAMETIDYLYQQVQPPQMRAPESPRNNSE
jgi:transcriptional regulator with XRE-family HTH domain